MMLEYTEKEKPVWMDLAFTSERSIEDELDRSSHSDVATILISYIIMFAYITIALGQIRTWGRLLVSTLLTVFHSLGLGRVKFVLEVF